MQVKTKGARKVTFTQFVDALSLIARKRGTSLCQAAQTVVAANGPAVSGTKADYVKFHDDKACPAIQMQFHYDPACTNASSCIASHHQKLC